jgi:hypothetical protein
MGLSSTELAFAAEWKTLFAKESIKRKIDLSIEKAVEGTSRPLECGFLVCFMGKMGSHRR